MERTPKADWKTYREHVEGWRERYLERKNREIVAILEDDERTETESFWDAKEKMKEEAEILERCLDSMADSDLPMAVLLMLRYGLMAPSDLEVFSDELQAWVRKAAPHLLE